MTSLRTDPTPRTVLIAGGGAAAIEAALALVAIPGNDLRVELIAADSSWAYRPMTVVEPFTTGLPRTYAIEALEELGVRIHRDELVAVDPERKIVTLASRAELPYDALLVATGSEPTSTLAFAASAIDTERLHGLIQDVEGGFCRRIAFVAPPGAGWTLPLYELVLQMAERCDDLCLDKVELTFITHERRPLQAFGTAASELLEQLLADADVTLVLGAVPDVPRSGRIVARPGEAAIEVDRIVAMPMARGRAVPGLPSTDRGFLLVDAHGRVRGVPGVYAAGDVTDHPLKQGGLATQQADVAAAAIAADAGLPVELEPFQPVLRGILIAGSACWYLIRELGGDPQGTVSNRPLWWPPTKIAGRHLSPFLDGRDAESRRIPVERRLGRDAGPVRRRAVITKAGDGEHSHTVVLAD